MSEATALPAEPQHLPSIFGSNLVTWSLSSDARCQLTNSSALLHHVGNPRSGKSSCTEENIDASVKKSGIDSSGVHSWSRCIDEGYSAGTHLRQKYIFWSIGTRPLKAINRFLDKGKHWLSWAFLEHQGKVLSHNFFYITPINQIQIPIGNRLNNFRLGLQTLGVVVDIS